MSLDIIFDPNAANLDGLEWKTVVCIALAAAIAPDSTAGTTRVKQEIRKTACGVTAAGRDNHSRMWRGNPRTDRR